VIGREDILVELWDSVTDKAIATLNDGTNLNLAYDLLKSGKATIAVTAVAGGDLDGEIGSVRLSLDDSRTRLENSAPYTLFGDTLGDAKGGLDLDNGDHSLRLEVYSASKGTGDLLGDFTFDFSAYTDTSSDALIGL